MLKTLLSLILVSQLLHAKEDPPCSQIDKTKLDKDGIPFCPDSVKENAYTVTRCAFAQAKKWHRATDVEQNKMKTLVQGLKDAAPQAIIAAADSLKLQVCRQASEGDSFLLLYTKPNVDDYSGPFLMYREGNKTSGIVIHSPHDGQDGTHRSTKAAFQRSNALALISNGHPRRISGEKKGPYASDWAHTRQDLGWTAFEAFKNKFPESIHLHLHGLAAKRVMVTDSVGWDAPHKLRGAFIDAFTKAIAQSGRQGFDVVAWRFNGWASGLAMTVGPNGKGRKDNERWVGAEISVNLHQGVNTVVNAVRFLEADYLGKPRSISEKTNVELEADPTDTVEEAETPLPDQEPELAPDFSMEKDEVGLPQSEDTSIDGEVEDVLPTHPSFAPYPKGNRGTKTLACIAVNYTNPINDYMNADRCLKVAKNVADFYGKNSGGRLKLIPKGYQMKYEGDGWKVFGQAEEAAKKEFAADYYIIPNLFRKGGNHASGKIAHVCQLTGWVVDHEVGHLLGMGHSGKYVYDKDGKPKLQAYGDEQSPMGNNGYKYLTAPEYYALGWLGKEGTVLYKEPATFELTRITADKKDGVLFGVLVKGERFFGKNLPPIKGKHRDAFVSFPAECPNNAKVCAALHLFQGAGSQRVMLISDDKTDENFTGLHIKVLGLQDGKLKVSLDFGSSVKK